MYGTVSSRYQSSAAETAGPAQLVLMLYDRALVGLTRARQAHGPGAREVVNSELQRVQDILSELTVTLDHERGGPIAANLASVYAFCTEQVIDANVRNDPSVLAGVQPLIAGLRDAWQQACCGAMSTAG